MSTTLAPAPRLEVLTVDPHEVEPGDTFVGCPAVVESITCDGIDWRYADRFGVTITRRAIGARVQVIRGGLTSHDAPAGGILRPTLRVVAS